jgi:hypothetical protein
VLLVMLLILGVLVAVEKRVSLAELRYLWTWKFGGRGFTLGPREATLTYNQFLKVVRNKGFRKSPAQTPREFALFLAGSRLGSGTLEFTRLYNLLRFGQSPVPLARLRELLEQIRGA